MSGIARVLERFGASLLEIPAEMGRIFPDALVLGIGFFSLITLSFPYFIFFVVWQKAFWCFTDFGAQMSILIS